MRIVHLPFYDDNPYQSLLMEAQRKLGHEVWEGGGGGNFLGVALREWKADLVHFHWLHPYLLRDSSAASIARATRFLAEVALLKARGARIAWTIHNLVNHGRSHPEIERWFSERFAALCDTYFVHSRAAGEAALKRFRLDPARLKVIPHGHYIDVYPNSVSRDEARRSLRLPANAEVYLFLGRVEPYKGIDELLEAFAGFPESCHLLIAGKVASSADPVWVQELENRARANPRIQLHLERIPDERLQIFYNASDVVVFPFRQILTSGSLILAMSFGKAVVAPSVQSLREITPEAGVHWFDAVNGPTLTEAMSGWTGEELRIAGLANRRAAESWRWEDIAQNCLMLECDMDRG